MRVTWAVMATPTPMGQQRYETEIQAAIMEMHLDDWEFRQVRVASVRSKAVDVNRYPAGLSRVAPLPAALLVGDLTYRTRGMVHRFDLRLPPHHGTEVITIHDLPPLRFSDEGRMPRYAKGSAQRAAAVIVPSTFAADEISTLLDVDRDRIHVVPYGVTAEYANGDPASEADLGRLGIEGPFVLHAAGATARKNLAGLAQAWRQVCAETKDVSLVLAGPPDLRRDREFRDIPRSLAVGRLEAALVARLMRRAEAVVVPSLYEGFGLPALEGLTCGVPVVAAAAGALPEVCGDAAELVPPTVDGLFEGLKRVLTDERRAGELRQRGPQRASQFSWSTAAEGHVSVYQKVRPDSA